MSRKAIERLSDDFRLSVKKYPVKNGALVLTSSPFCNIIESILFYLRRAGMPCGKKRKRKKMSTHKRKKKLRKNRHKNKK